MLFCLHLASKSAKNDNIRIFLLIVQYVHAEFESVKNRSKFVESNKNKKLYLNEYFATI